MAAPAPAAGEDDAGRSPEIYVPYRDLAAFLDPAAKAVLMERDRFEKLLAAAMRNQAASGEVELAQITRAAYAASVASRDVELTGTMTVLSLSDKPVAMPLVFGQIGLTQLRLDGAPAPLGYDKQGHLVLIVTGKGEHPLTVSATGKVSELSGGGMRLGLTIPPAVAGKLTLTVGGDLEIHSTSPVTASAYDKPSDRTTAELTIGGKSNVSIVLMGNGRQEEYKAILLGESASSLRLNRAQQTLNCLYTVQVLRRGVRDLKFSLPANWTITEVACPSLVKWSLAGGDANGTRELTVRLRTASRGEQALHIQAMAARGGNSWSAPPVQLVGADFQRGYLLVDSDEEIRVRREKLADARREDVSAAAALPGMAASASGRLYYHWGDKWSVNLELAEVEIRRGSRESQLLTILPDRLALNASFEITAIGREMFDVSFDLPARSSGWNLGGVTVNGSNADFEFRVAEAAGKRTLRIDLSRPLQAESAANVTIILNRAADWDFSDRSKVYEVSGPLICAQCDTVSGVVSVAAGGDLEVLPKSAPQGLKPVTVGRMTSLGLGALVQLAYTYDASPGGNEKLLLDVSRRKPRVDAESVGLITARPTGLEGDWRITYGVARAATREFRLLVDKAIGQDIKIETPQHRLASKRILPPDANAPAGYDVWELVLDDDAAGIITVQAHYDHPMGEGAAAVPLVRPWVENATETLAVQGSEELALTVQASGASEMDAVDLPPLPGAAWRLVAAYRLGPLALAKGPSQSQPAPAAAATCVAGILPALTTISQPQSAPTVAPTEIRLKTTTHGPYAIPAALATYGTLTTYLGPDGSQRTQAEYGIVNAGLQFLAFRLPAGAQLWSVRVGEQQAKPKSEAPSEYLVSIPRCSQPVVVRIVYAAPGECPDKGRVKMGGVELAGLKVNQLAWRVVPPPGLLITSQSGMQTADIPAPSPAYLAIGDVLDSIFSHSIFSQGILCPSLSYKIPGGGGPVTRHIVPISYRYTLDNEGSDWAAMRAGPPNKFLDWGICVGDNAVPGRVARGMMRFDTSRYTSVSSAVLHYPALTNSDVIPVGSLIGGVRGMTPTGANFLHVRPASLLDDLSNFGNWPLLMGSGPDVGIISSGPGTLDVTSIYTSTKHFDLALIGDYDARNVSPPSQDTRYICGWDDHKGPSDPEFYLEITTPSSPGAAGGGVPVSEITEQEAAAPLAAARETRTLARGKLRRSEVPSAAFFQNPEVEMKFRSGVSGEQAESLGEYKSTAAGRYTLPVELAATPGGNGMAVFSSLGGGDLVVELGRQTALGAWQWVGFALVTLLGVAMLRASAGRKTLLVAAVLLISTLVAIWSPGATPFANGAFYAALLLIPFYLMVATVVWILRRVGLARRVAPAVIAACILLSAGSAFAGGVPSSQPASPQPAPILTARPAAPSSPLVVPYEGDPTKAQDSTKVLVPYSKFVELWNQANPDKPIDTPPPAGGVSLAGVTYEAAVSMPRATTDPAGGAEAGMTVTLTADLKVLGKGWVTLPMPMSGLAVVESTFADKPASLQVGPRGMVLALEGGSAGRLKVSALATPQVKGRAGAVQFVLPPLPGAVMKVLLPQDDLVLEAQAIDGALTSKKVPGGVEWTVPLTGVRELALRWSPKTGEGEADRTLSAATAHEVHVFHWGLVGISKIAYTFSAGQYDRFSVLVPARATLTELTGANVRDYRTVDDRKLPEGDFKSVEVRLYRPASKSCELTARWVAPLPALKGDEPLMLPMAANVGRESGVVTLHAAGGMVIQVADVEGGRRTDLGGGEQAAPSASGSLPVAQYYWPYRPFTLKLHLSRLETRAEAKLDQLVRVSPDSVQLLAEAKLTAIKSRIFGASFQLPGGYELLSAVGPDVGDWYIQTIPSGRLLHVSFRSGVASTSVVAVLVRNDPNLAHLPVPAVTLLDAAAEAPAEQTGRLAVQVAPSLAAQTENSENLKPIAPSATAPWLMAEQIAGVQFAYEYEKPIALTLAIKRQPTKVRVEIFSGVTLRPTAANYSYRLRYTIDGSPIDRVSFTLPKEYAAQAAVSSAALRSVTESDAGAGRTRWTVSLLNEVTGVLDLAVNFAAPVDADTAELPVPRIDTEAPEGCRAIVAVQNFSRHEISVARSKELSPLPPGEQKELLPEAIRGSLQYVFESFSGRWELTLGVKPAKEAARIQAVVDLLALTTVIDRQGRCRCQAALTLQNRSEQYLRIRTDEGLMVWSAAVAGQPVKPVIEANAPPGEVLIPLVKTSPGGLPYDVSLYLAARTGMRLDGITRVRPPRLQVVNMPVTWTTWSLRLPAGMRYMRPGGNMSPVAGTAEKMLINIEARLGQLQRLENAFSSEASSFRGKDMAGANLQRFNLTLTSDIQQAEQYISANGSDQAVAINQSLDSRAVTYGQLKSRLREQKGKQSLVLSEFDEARKVQQSQIGNDFGAFVMNNSTNGGTPEVVRNGAILAMPEFVQNAGLQQQQALQRELVEAQKLDIRPEGPAIVGKGISAEKAPRADDLLATADEDKRKDVGRLLDRIEQDQAARVVQKQDQLKRQLSKSADNSLTRYYTDTTNTFSGSSTSNSSYAQVVINAAGGPLDLNGQTVPNGSVYGLSNLSRNNSPQGATSLTLGGAGNGRFGGLAINQAAPAQVNTGVTQIIAGNVVMTAGNQPVAGQQNPSIMNTYSGGTVVNSGGQNLGSGQVQLGSNNARVFSGQTEWAAGAGTLVEAQAGTVSGSGSLSLAQGSAGEVDGSLKLGGTNTYTGVTTVNGGTLTTTGDDRNFQAHTVGGANNVNGGAITLNGGNLTVNGCTGSVRITDLSGITNINVTGVGTGGGRAGGAATQPGLGESGPYVAQGTYSLEAQLPSGEVELDFAYGGADAAVTVWAVPSRLIDSLWGTLGVVVIAAVLFASARLWRRFAGPRIRKAMRLVLGFCLLAVVLAALIGPWGIAVAIVVILLTAVGMSLPLRRRAA